MYYSVNDANYWYEIHGNGVPVVLLHGFTGSTSTWKRFIEVASSQLQLITVDLPGHGKTMTQSPRTMEACCKDLQSLFSHLELEEIHLVGYSMGGRTALSYAMFDSKRIETLTLESASPGLKTEKERKERRENDKKLAKKIKVQGIESFVKHWENIPLFDSQKRLPHLVRDSIRKERLKQSPEGLAMSLRSMGTGSQPSWWEHLKDFSSPVLLITGELDEKYIDINKEMSNLFLNAQLIICEDTGHAIHVEKPEIFGKLVTEFILS